MHQIGATNDDRKVMAGIAKLYFEQGLPLGMIFDHLWSHNAIPSWPLLYKELHDNGMSHERIVHLLHEHMHDTYGKAWRDEVIQRLEKTKHK